ncbi:hypothetical protein HanRHA438_Chr04g0166761 [Helianthus annuus]|nr:hypothetical protein HanRHA438_Chr04g0166761 [Helianthus annuus]
MPPQPCASYHLIRSSTMDHHNNEVSLEPAFAQPILHRRPLRRVANHLMQHH